MGRLDNKVAVITGAASGIGRATARRFAAEGANVVVADFDERAGAEVAEEVGGLYVKVDVADEASVVAMYDATVQALGGIDILFNNAGISPADDDSILTTGLEAWQRVQDVNLKSVYLCCKYGIPTSKRAVAARSSIRRRSWRCSDRRRRRFLTPHPRAASWP